MIVQDIVSSILYLYASTIIPNRNSLTGQPYNTNSVDSNTQSVEWLRQYGFGKCTLYISFRFPTTGLRMELNLYPRG